LIAKFASEDTEALHFRGHRFAVLLLLTRIPLVMNSVLPLILLNLPIFDLWVAGERQERGQEYV
jgi:hypothetical protein